MKAIKILQEVDFEHRCDALYDTTGYTVKNLDLVDSRRCDAERELEETLTPEQRQMFEQYLFLEQIYKELASEFDFQSGFKLATRIMAESMS